MKLQSVKNIIAIGASAGGINAVSRLVAAFHDDLDAAVFIVIHTAKHSVTGVILAAIQKNTLLKCVIPTDQQSIENRTIYLAPADHHMLLERGTIRITRGAYENHWRPSIDVMLRSAAVAYNSCVTGIILTGLLDDGVSGMHAIKRSGGLCMIQEPTEADFPDMPNNVLHNIEVDYVVPVDEMGHILTDLLSRTDCVESEVPEEVLLEAKIANRMSSEPTDLLQLGDMTQLTCPDCGGTLVRIGHDAVPRYRCYTGHTFTEKALEQEQLKGIEDSLWVAIRMLEERKNLLATAYRQHVEKDGNADASYKKQRADQMEMHVNRLKVMLTDVGESARPAANNVSDIAED